ncbi:hypothetical protein AR543_15210 [Paenibacillus bovis]|uniref:AAA domain-containing protein n=2 Tax=Paenibacillus bovis TaxID=1616788 RepID=A0A172ZHV1_9BACL|nr:hypothetical protein AR543_15210 [Paenibacillus bovis]
MTTVMFWSPDKGNSRTSSHAAITAITASLQYRLKLLLCHNQYRYHSVEAGLLSTSTDTDISADNADRRSIPGIDRLYYSYKSGILTRSNVSSYMIALLQNRLDLLAGTDKAAPIPADDLFWKYMLHTAGLCYDLILLDAGSGLEQMPLLAEADLVIVNLGQDLVQLNTFFHEYAHHEVMRSRVWIPVLGAYQTESALTAAWIANQFKVEQDIYRLNAYQDFEDAWNAQNLFSFMRHQLMLDGSHDTSAQSAEFLRQSFFLAAAILEQLGGISVVSGAVIKFPVHT